MSALAGIWRLDGEPGAPAQCARMLEAQRLYGPHVGDQWDGLTEDSAGERLSLGRRLFRLLPEDDHDQGPIVMPDGGCMVADARLDNRLELEDDLGLEPLWARRMADPAIIAAAWMRWGEGCLERLIGDFAIAIWDAPRRRLLLARDPLGHRPLHWHRTRRVMAFASMPRGLHALIEVPHAPNEAQVAAFLALAPEDGPDTAFEGIQRVEPGAVLVSNAEGARSRRYYRPRLSALRLAEPDDYAQALAEQLDRAVKARLRGAEAQVGAHLSSGWDSAAVAATAARLMAPTGGRVIAFTATPRPGWAGAAPEGRHADEGDGASLVAAMYSNMDHVRVPGAGRSPLDDLDRDIALCGRPSLNPCNHLWFNDINRAASVRGVRVMLTGDFGNLTLTDDGQSALPDLIASGEWLTWWRLARAVERGGALRWRGVLAASFEDALPVAAWRSLRRLQGEWLGRPGSHSALRPEVWRRSRPARRGKRPGRAARAMSAMTHLDLSSWTKGALAGFGVDLRDPLTDQRLMEFCLSLPIDPLIADGRTRSLARKVLGGRLPTALLDLPTRGYQGADWHEGLTADWETVARDVERLADLPAAARMMDIERLKRLAGRWPSSGWTRPEILSDYRQALLRGLSAGRFLTHTLRPNG